MCKATEFKICIWLFNFRAMINEQKNNFVLVSGESGTGKIEATKLLGRYLAFISGTTDSGEDR
jgi:myosin heavy subunit